MRQLKKLNSNKNQKALNLESIETHHWRIVGCSAMNGDNLLAGIDWLVEDIGARIFTLE